jgi:hypothetical protein
LSGLAPAQRAYSSFERGDIGTGVANAANAALPYVAAPLAGPVTRGAEMVASTMARFPATSGAAIAAGTALAAPGQTADTPPLPPARAPAARESLTQVENEQKALAARRQALDQQYNQFRSLPTDNRERDDRVVKLQEFLNSPEGGAAGLKIDGINKGKTTEALRNWLARVDQRRTQLNNEAQRLSGRWETASAGLRKAEEDDALAVGAARMRETGQPTWLESWGPLAGFTGGVVAGGLESVAAGRAVRALEAGRLARANRLLGEMGTGTPTERASRVNQFWTEGGASNNRAPFNYEANTRPYPFTPNDQAANASQLYQPRNVEVFAPATIIGLKGAAESGVAYSQLEAAHKDLTEARIRLQERPNDESRIQAVLEARNKVAALETALRFGAGEAVGAFGETLISRYTHKPPRPDVYRAERERGDVDLLLNPPPPPQPPGPPPPPAPPSAGGPPHQPGVTRYRNPATGEERFMDNAGRWQGPHRGGGHGWTQPPPATWQRISTRIESFGGFPVG